MVQLLWTTVWRFLKKLRIELPRDPAILLLGNDESRVSKNYSHTHVHSSTSHNGHKVEAAQMSTEERMDRRKVRHPHSGILSSLKREGHSDTRYRMMNIEEIRLREISQTQRQIPCDSTSVRSMEESVTETECGMERGMGVSV